MSNGQLSDQERRALLQIARASIAEKFSCAAELPEIPDTPAMGSLCGVFVTLHKKGCLRGCIGSFTSEIPLPMTIDRMAKCAAFEDPRFPELRCEELDDMDLEISVLSPMCKIDDPAEVEVGKHGLYMVCGYRRGVLLPQVAVEQGWDRDTFLEHTCLKAGLKSGCWKDSKTEIFIVTAEVFGEKDLVKSAGS